MFLRNVVSYISHRATHPRKCYSSYFPVIFDIFHIFKFILFVTWHVAYYSMLSVALNPRAKYTN
jgi:hypothetical protein